MSFEFAYIKTESGLRIKYPKAYPLIEITKLKKNSLNVKEHPAEQIHDLAELIKLIGFKDPIVIDKSQDNLIFAGHGRLDAAELLGMPAVPWYPLKGLSEDQKKLFLIMDNRVNESPWNLEAVKIILNEIPKIELENYQLTLDSIIPGLKPSLREEKDEIPKKPSQAISKLGDLYELGSHRILCGDSSKESAKLLNGTIVNLEFTDPPYNINYKEIRSQKRTIENDKMDSLEFMDFIGEALNVQSDATYVCCNWQSLAVFEQVLQAIKKTPKACIVWDKEIRAQNLDKYYKQHEFILYSGPFGNQKTICGDIWRFPWHYSESHPTAKPVEMVRQAVMDSTDVGEVVYDPFLGSGSTLIACEQTNRVCYGIEIEPIYIDVAIKRWENFTGKKAKKLA